MFEGTANEMGECISKMEDAKTIDDLDMNGYEQDGFRVLYKLSKAYIKHYERLSDG
jgi:hypothetical protein